MFPRLLFNRNAMFVTQCISECRYAHGFSRQLFRSTVSNKSPKQISYNVFRYASSRPTIKNKIPIVAGIGAIGVAAIAYLFNKKSTDSEDDVFETQFLHEHLNDDLALLSDYGPVPYLLIGAGTASFSALKAIHARDPTAKVLMIGDEPYFPYMRPPLSKGMWFDNESDPEALTFTKSDGKKQSVFFERENYYSSIKDLLDNKHGGISIIRGKKVVKIDPTSQVVFLDKGETIQYQKCLIATGSKPKNLPVFENVQESIKKHITVFRSVTDFKKLNKICKKIDSIVVVGGGFLGSELACGLLQKGGSSHLKVIQLFPETGVLAKVLPEYLSTWTSMKMKNEGVNIIPEVEVKSVSKEGNEILLHLNNNKIVRTKHIIVAVGADPNVELAKASGLEVDSNKGGLLVNTELEARKNLFVAGDASCFFDVLLGRRRVEHHDHAVVSGQLAGNNMAGDKKPYWHQSMFWSDLGQSVGFEALGIIDSSLPTVGVFSKPETKIDKKGGETQILNSSNANVGLRAPNISDNFEKGVIFYLKDDIIVGIITWNLFGKMQLARKIIGESKSSDDVSEVANLFEMNTTE